MNSREKRQQQMALYEQLDSLNQHTIPSLSRSKDVHEKVDRLLIDKLIESKANVTWKPKKHKSFKPLKSVSAKKILLPLISLALVFVVIASMLPVFYGTDDFDINVSIEPADPVEGDLIFINATIPTHYNITNVSANISGIDTINLTLIANTTIDNLSTDQFWQGTWILHNLSAGDHIVNISAVDFSNTSYYMLHRWIISSNFSENESVEDDTGWDNESLVDNTTIPLDQNDTNITTNESMINETTDILDNDTFVPENETVNETVTPVDITDENITTNVTTISIIDSRDEHLYIVPGTRFSVERTVDGPHGTEVIFVPLFSDALTLDYIEILEDNKTTEQQKKIDSMATHLYKVGKARSSTEQKIDTLRQTLPSHIRELDQVAYSNSFELHSPRTVRIWFTAPSFEAIQSGNKPSSGHISYLVFIKDENMSNTSYDYESSTWWNSNWNYRKLITVNHSQVDADLTNFPILVYESSDSDLASKAQDDGDDIAFVLWNDNSTKLNHEIELFNGTSGKLAAWVNITSLSSSVDTKIWMYYNNSDCSNQENVEDTWDSNYSAVWHMNDNTTSSIIDSTSNHNNGTKKGANEPIVNSSGKIGDAQTFDNTNEYINCGHDTTLDITGSMTMEVWANSEYSGYDNMLNKYWGTYTLLTWSGTYFGLRYTNETDALNGGRESTSSTTNVWHYVVGVIDISANASLYVDNSLRNSTAFKGTSINSRPSNDVSIGCGGNVNANYFNGSIDEVRISNIARNTSWMNASYNTMNSPSTFLSFGSQEDGVKPNISFVPPTPPDNNQTTNTYAYINVSVTDPSNTSSFIDWDNSLVGYWNFEHTNSTHVFDNSTYGNNGTRKYANITSVADVADTNETQCVDDDALQTADDVFNGWTFMATSGLASGNTTIITDYVVVNSSYRALYFQDELTGFNEGDSYALWLNTGLPNVTTGKFGSAFNFDSGDYVDCGNDASFDITDEITIEAWVKYGTFIGWPRLVSKSRISAYALRIMGTGKIELAAEFGGVAQGNDLWSSSGFNQGEWAHVAATYNGTTIQYYINGADAGNVTPATTGPIGTNSLPLCIGGESPGDAFLFNGSIDEVRVWNRVLSWEEINASYNSSDYKLYHNFTGLSVGNYSYYAHAIDAAGNENTTETRNLEILSPEPTQSSPSPPNGSTDVSTTPVLNVTVDDADNDTLTAYWYSNSSSSWALFATNSSIDTNSGAVNIGQTNNNFSNYSITYYWSVNLTDGTYWCNETYHFTTELITTSVDEISPYDTTSSPLTINATAQHNDYSNITLWYRYSSNNSNWGNASDWWNTSWKYRKKLTIDHNQVDDDLTNFPILVSITDTALANSAQDDGDDIVFTNITGTKLNHEIESFNGTTGNLIAWVNVTSLSGSTDTEIYMYFGNTTCTSQQNAAGTWDGDYVAVWHFNNSFNDSSGNNYNGTNTNMVSATGITAGGMQNSDAEERVVNVTNWYSLNDQITAEIWLNLDNNDETFPRIFMEGPDWNDNDWGVYLRTQDDFEFRWLRVSQFEQGGNVPDDFGSGVGGVGYWWYLWGTYDEDGGGAGIDPSSMHYNNTVDGFDDVFDSGSSLPVNYNYLLIGNDAAGNSWDGRFDEVRISKVVRSNEWMNATYNTMINTTTFLTVGAEEGWMQWTDGTNPDEGSPWSWNFDSPNGSGYYEFYSIGKKSGSTDEIPPDIADAKCHYNLDIIKPNISFVPPTPNDNNQTTDTNAYAYINVSTTDINNISSFIDWDNSLVGYWNFEHTNSTSVYDNSTYDNNGTFNGGLGESNITYGKYGNALEFDGSSNYLDCGNNDSLEMKTYDMSVTAWIKIDTPPGTYLGIATKGAGSPTDEGYTFVYNSVYDDLLFYISNGTTRITPNSNHDLGLNDSKWHFVAVSANRSAAATFYVDGAPVGWESINTLKGKDISNSGRNLQIGRWISGNYFNGTIDEVCIYNRALSLEEIKAAYNSKVNQLYHNFTGLAAGNYAYYAHAIDTAGNKNTTETRNFTVIAVPQLSNPNPADGEKDVSITQSNVSVYISHATDTMNWTIEVNNSDSNSGNDAGDGTINCTLTTPLAEGCKYTWWVNVTDGTHWTNETYQFTTLGDYFNWTTTEEWEKGAGQGVYIREGEIGIGGYDDFEDYSEGDINASGSWETRMNFGNWSLYDDNGDMVFRYNRTPSTDARSMVITDQWGNLTNMTLQIKVNNTDYRSMPYLCGRVNWSKNQDGTTGSGALRADFYGVRNNRRTTPTLNIVELDDGLYIELSSNTVVGVLDGQKTYLKLEIYETGANTNMFAKVWNISDSEPGWRTSEKNEITSVDDGGCVAVMAYSEEHFDICDFWLIGGYSSGNYTTEWRNDSQQILEWDTLNYTTDGVVANNQEINITVQVSNDGSTVLDSMAFDASDGTNEVNISSFSDARYLRIVANFTTTNETKTAELESYSIHYTPDTIKPNISFVPPTPPDNNQTTNTYAYVNVSVTDPSNTSSFIDWDNSLVGYWNFEHTNSTHVFDNSAYNNHGTFNGGLSQSDLTTGRYGNALEFDASNDHLDVGESQWDGSPANHTFEAWIYRKGDANSSEPAYPVNPGTAIFSKGGGKPSGYCIFINDSDERIVFSMGGTEAYSTISVTNNVWQHVVVVVNENEDPHFYLNGQAAGSDTMSYTSNNNYKFYISGMDAPNDFGFFNGTIDEVRIHSRDLSPEEINASYNSKVNQLYHNFTGLNEGNYTYYAHAIDTAGNENTTETRNFSVIGDPPGIEFVPPTPNNNTVTSNTYAYINVSVDDSSDTSSFIDWNNTLAGYWNFEHTNSTHVFDNSTYGNHGTFNGTNFGESNITDGKYGHALEFDGDSDYIEVESDDSLKPGASDFTVSYWIKTQTTGREIISKRTGPYTTGGIGWNQMTRPDGRIGGGIGNGTSFILDITPLTNSSVIDGSWHFVVIIYNRTGEEIVSYVDRSYDRKTDISSVKGSISNDNVLRMGVRSYTLASYFNGTLDEVCIYNRVLSPEEINASYNSKVNQLYHNFTGLSEGNYTYYAHTIDTGGNENITETRTLTVDTTKPNISFVPPTPWDNNQTTNTYAYINVSVTDPSNTSSFIDWNRTLVGYWSMDHYNSTGIYDNSTYDNFGDFKGSLDITRIVSGEYGDGLEFDGDGDYVDAGDNTLFDIPDNSQKTFSAWIKPTDTSGYKTIVSQSDGGLTDDTGYIFTLTDDTLGFFYNNGTGGSVSPDGTATFSAGAWQHAVVVVDRINDEVTFYRNGGQSNTVTLTVGIDGTWAKRQNLFIGSLTTTVWEFNGTIDEVRVWNRALSQEEINASYNSKVNQLYHNFTGLGVYNYSYYAHAIDAAGNENITETRHFEVLAVAPTVLTNASTGVEETNATLWGYLQDDGNGSTICGFRYGNSSGSYSLNVTYGVVSEGGEFSYNASRIDAINWSYDEDADSYQCDDDWNAGDLCTEVYDGNWNSDGKASSGYYAHLIIEYNKPSNALSSSLWHVKDLKGEVNLSIPSDCWNQDPLRLKVRNAEIGAPMDFSTRWSAWTGDYWDELRSGGSLLSRAYPYEEAMWWNVTPILSPGQLYYYQAWGNNSVGFSNGSELLFLTKPDPPSDFAAHTLNYTKVNLTWTKGSVANKTVIRRDTTGYPATPQSGTEVYNDTGTNYSDTVSGGDTYYYSAWSYTTWGSLHQWSDGNISAINLTTPVILTNASTGVEETNATLHGYLEDDGNEPCTVRFEYGKTTSYGNVTSNQTISSENEVNTNLDGAKLYEYCNDGDTSAFYAYGLINKEWLAQTFTPSTSHTIKHVKLKLFRDGSPGTVTVGIRSVSDERPTGSDLTSGNIDGNSLTTSSSGEWYQINLTEYSLSADTEYAIVVRAPGGDISNLVSWRYGADLLYNGGAWCRSPENWGGWMTIPTLDFMFEEYEYVPLDPGTLYRYRAVANNTNGTVYGSDQAFLTKPQPPTSLTSQANNSSVIYLTWVVGAGANNTYIERNTSGVSVWARGDGDMIYNDSGTNYEDSGLGEDVTYYYQAWSYTTWTYNPTLHQWSDENASDNGTTTVPVVTTNSSTGVEETNATLCGYLEDDSGESCTVRFEYGNTTSYGTNTTNQTKTTGDEFSDDPCAETLLCEYYNTNDDAQYGTQEGNYLIAQTFTPSKAHSITSIKIKVFRNAEASSGNLTIGIRATDGNGKPTGADLTNGTYSVTSITTSSPGLWYEITVASYSLSADTKYAIVYRSTNPAGYVFWRRDSSSATYAGGTRLYSSDGGSSWTAVATEDFMFEEYGVLLLSPGTLYHYRAVANNSFETVYGSDMAFLTKPEAPTNLNATAYNSTQINLTCTKGAGANNTYIEYNTTFSSWPRGQGTAIYNNTGTSHEHTGLTEGTTYYYRVWSYTTWTYNPTVHQWSDENASASNTTLSVKPSISFDMPPTPVNNSQRTQNWAQINVTVSDPSNTSGFIDWNNSLVGYWNFEHTNSTHVFDNSTYGNNGTFNGANFGESNLTTGKYGDALEFDGTNDYLDCKKPSEFEMDTDDFSIDLWLNMSEIDDTREPVLFKFSEALSNAGGYAIFVESDGNISIFLQEPILFGDSVTIKSTTPVNDDEWHHIVATFNRSGNGTLYVDGILDNQESITSIGSITDTREPLHIGREVTGLGDYFLKGMIDEVIIYRRILSPEEINASYNSKINQLYHNFTGLSVGNYTYYAHAIDTAGNENTTETRHFGVLAENTSINVTPSQWNIGTIDIGDTNATTGFYFNLTNEGNVALDITVNATNATNSTGAKWNLTSTPAHDNFSLQYNLSGAGSWTPINITFDTFVTDLAIGGYQTFDLKLLMATTSSTVDPMEVTVTFKSVVS